MTKERTKILFIDNLFYNVSKRQNVVQIVPHLGLLSLSAVLENAGYIAEIFDPKIYFAKGRWSLPEYSFYKSCTEHVLSKKPDIIGFTTLGRSFPFVIKVSQLIRSKSSSIPIILGGPHATILGEVILRQFNCFDVVVCHEGELVILSLVKRLLDNSDLRTIPSLMFRRGKSIVKTPTNNILPEMDDLPLPALHLYPIQKLKLSELPIEAGRGCPFSCNYCSTTAFFKRKYRLKSNRRLIIEMKKLREKFGINTFTLNHDLFTFRRDKVLEFCKNIISLGFHWKCSTRPDYVDPEILIAMQNAGCIFIYFGIETGSSRLQSSIGKRLDLNLTKNTIQNVTKLGISCMLSFITGFPDETETDQDDTLDLMGSILTVNPKRVQIQFHLLSPEPGSILMSSHKDQIVFDGIGPDIEEILDKTLICSNPELFSVFYHFKSITPRWRSLFVVSFMTHIALMLGIPLLTHICINVSEGKLSSLFHHVLPKVLPSGLAAGGIQNLLLARFRRFLFTLPQKYEYLKDLVNFVNCIQRTYSIKSAEYLETISLDNIAACKMQLVDGAVLKCFHYDVFKLLMKIHENPMYKPSNLSLKLLESWYIIFMTSSGLPSFFSFDLVVGRTLQTMLSKPQRSLNNISFSIKDFSHSGNKRFEDIQNVLYQLSKNGLLKHTY